MSRPYSLTNPAPGHNPEVGRFTRGGGWGGHRQHYGTTLTCSCGEKLGQTHRYYGTRDDGSYGVTKEYTDTHVANEAPSQGGRSYANDRYKRHLREVEAREGLPTQPG